MAQRDLSIVYRPIDSFRLDPQNPRLHNKKQIRQIARSIETFGFNVPVLIDGQGQVIAGHGRVLAAQFLGVTKVPTITLEHLTEAQTRAFMIADNRLTENSAWNDRLLAEQLKALSVLDLDFSLEVTGFELGEIDMRVRGLAPASRGEGDRANAIPDPGAKPQITQAGDLWVLNRHRVYCSDAQNESAYAQLMEGRQAQMVFTDPPYNSPNDDFVSGLGEIHHLESANVSREIAKSGFIDFLTNTLCQLVRNSIDGALHFVCMDWRHAAELIGAARSVYTEFKDLCVWVKDTAIRGSLYPSQHGLVFVFKTGKRPSSNNIQLGQHGRSNVWHYPRVRTSSQSNKKRKLSELHPTVKPVELVADAILDCTARGDVVLDPFLGIGTVVVAAERTGRVCCGIELNPHCVDTIVRRWQAFTGQNAVQELTGRTFNEIEEEHHGRAD